MHTKSNGKKEMSLNENNASLIIVAYVIKLY